MDYRGCSYLHRYLHDFKSLVVTRPQVVTSELPDMRPCMGCSQKHPPLTGAVEVGAECSIDGVPDEKEFAGAGEHSA